MTTYTTRFTKYDPRTTERRLSGIIHLNADSFRAAVAIADSMIAGMRSVDPRTEFEIMAIQAAGYRGVDCASGGDLWETQDEFAERVAAKSGLTK